MKMIFRFFTQSKNTILSGGWLNLKKEGSMKTYSCEVYRYDRHGAGGAQYTGICVWSVEANNKKEAKEQALWALVGVKHSEYPDLIINMEEAIEAKKDEYGFYSMSYEDCMNHIMTEEDIFSKSSRLVVDVTVEE